MAREETTFEIFRRGVPPVETDLSESCNSRDSLRISFPERSRPEKTLLFVNSLPTASFVSRVRVQFTIFNRKFCQVTRFSAGPADQGLESASRALQEARVSSKEIAKKSTRADRFHIRVHSIPISPGARRSINYPDYVVRQAYPDIVSSRSVMAELSSALFHSLAILTSRNRCS